MPNLREHYTEDAVAKNVALVSDRGSYLVTTVCIKHIGSGTELQTYVKSDHGPLRAYFHSVRISLDPTDPFWQAWSIGRVQDYVREFPEPVERTKVPSRYTRPPVI